MTSEVTSLCESVRANKFAFLEERFTKNKAVCKQNHLKHGRVGLKLCNKMLFN